MAADRPKVVYVMGAGRSGSTILGVALGNCDGVCYAGELDAWLSRGGEPNFKNAERVEFWARVAERMTSPPESFGDSAYRLIERSTAALRILKGARRRDLEWRYRHLNAALYESIASVSEAEVIVDTSHFPLRARALQKIHSIDLYLVYLVRCPEDVIAAFGRKGISQPSKGGVAANAYLALTYLLSILVFLRHPRRRRLVVRYEDFIADPSGGIRQVLTMAGLQLGRDPFRHPTLSTGVAFQGNRLLGRDQVALESGVNSYSMSVRVRALPQLPWRIVARLLRPRFSPGSG